MSKRFLSAILLSLFTASQSTFAKEIHPSQECLDVNSQVEAKARLQELSKVGSSTGAKFTGDTSNPALGEAYKDESGLIWGSAVTADGRISRMSQKNAAKYCNDRGARLPTIEEFMQLAVYLGRGTAHGYSPFLADRKTELLPGLSSGRWFWSSSPMLFGIRIFNGDNGYSEIGLRNNPNFNFAVRCVSPAQ